MTESQAVPNVAPAGISGWRAAEGAVEPKLPRGNHGIPHEEVKRSQKGRMLRACLEHLGRDGKVNVSQIVKGAGVSRKAFYESYIDLDACILDALITANVVLGTEMLAAIELADPSDPTYKIRTLVREFCQMSSEEPQVTVAIAGTAYALNQATRQVWTEVLNARRGIVLAYWAEAQMRDPELRPTTPDRAMAAGRFLEGRILEEISAGREAQLPVTAESIADSFIEIVGG